ncbi:MAG: hypothetical protein PUB80_06425 [Clostridiales bacterium]|nr:hypothetical protein [Clostridiales bacterium]
MTLTWVESQLEDALSGPNTAKNVYDAAALIIVRDAMRSASAPSAAESTDAGEKARRDAILLTAHSADLDKVPTLAEVEDALGAVVVNTPEERERANRVKTWAEILRK